MKTKTVFCVGYRSINSAGFDWYFNANDAAEGFVEAQKEYGSLENDPHDIVHFNVIVPAYFTKSKITEFIDKDLDTYIDAAINH